MAYLSDVLDRVNELAEELLNEAKLVRASKAGLDERCGNVYIGDDFIAVPIHFNRWLQYYGGFEYVDADCWQVIGDYAFYSVDDDRVAKAHDEANGVVREEEEG